MEKLETTIRHLVFVPTQLFSLQILHFLRTRAHPEMLKKVCAIYFVLSAILHLALFGLQTFPRDSMTLATMLDADRSNN